ncbi:MAG: GNAT family N-acetyltransferase [Acidobacteria bacterium]|nr:GNAT family N-acetyltransferase [Acidobacteriota bacterium]MCA1608217.1 GNAT family N-acetyltransferase [Acidobacteriota bacterium]
MLTIIEAKTGRQIDAARSLFREYESWLGLDLCFQGFEDELRSLPGKYASPDGRLLLATCDGQPAGCIAMRKLETDACEMKRLFVRDEFRSLGLGRRLIEKTIEAARGAGYKSMRLDTYPAKMAKAVKLYKSYGFAPIPPYYDNPNEGVLFMELGIRGR